MNFHEVKNKIQPTIRRHLLATPGHATPLARHDTRSLSTPLASPRHSLATPLARSPRHSLATPRARSPRHSLATTLARSPRHATTLARHDDSSLDNLLARHDNLLARHDNLLVTTIAYPTFSARNLLNNCNFRHFSRGPPDYHTLPHSATIYPKTHRDHPKPTTIELKMCFT